MENNNSINKQSFYFGLAVGVAAVSLIGFLIMAFANSGKGDLEIGKIPQKNSKTNDQAKEDNTQNNKNDDSGSSLTIPAALGVPSKKVGDVWIRGNEKAPITIEEYSDIQCPFCTRFHDTMKQVMKAYPNQVKWVFKHFPLDSIHPYARKAAEATECAGDQGKFWEFLDALYANQSSLGNDDIYAQIADKLGMNADDLDECISAGKYSDKVSDDLSAGQDKGVRGTPGSFLNGKEIKGAQPFDSVKKMIDEELKK